MIWLVGILNIYLDEQRLIRYYLIKHLILLKPRENLDGYQRGLVSVVYIYIYIYIFLYIYEHIYNKKVQSPDIIYLVRPGVK